MKVRSNYIAISILLFFLLIGAGCQSSASSASLSSPLQNSDDAGTQQVQQQDNPAASVANSAVPKASPAKTVQAEPSNNSKQPSEKASSTTNNPSTSNKPSTSLSPSASPAQTENPSTTIQIVGDKAHGVILPKSKIEWKEGDTVLKVLQRVTKTSGIQMETSGIGASAYIRGIDNLYEFDQGAKSGWVFRVNGTFSNKGAGSYSLKRGDAIELLYTLDLGKDVGDAQ